MSIPAPLSIGEQSSVKAVATKNCLFLKLLSEFPDITRPPGTIRARKHNTEHHITTTDGPPVSCRPRRLGPQKLTAAKKEFGEMVRCGTARPSKSPWSSPLHMAQKRDATWRPCGDYRALNSRTIPDRYPVRHIGDFNQAIAGCTIFSSIDLIKAYQQIPVFEADIEKTAITTPFGMFEFPYMTFGLRNAGQTFQRFIDEVTQGLDFTYSYVDDILVFSRNAEQHAEHLRTLFQRLQDYGVVVNPSKCHLGADRLVFLGYHISAEGTRPPPERIQALQDFPLPKTIQGLRRFLGMINYYRRFLPHAAELQAPLIDALAATKDKGAKPFPWTPELEQCFEACKVSLTNATVLAHPVGSAPLALFTDASSTQVGACLQQRINDAWQPIAFFSKKLTATQSEWPAYYRELLAVYESIQHFRHILEAQHATVYTDHKPLVYAFTQRREKLPPAQLNQLSFISQFTTDIVHVPGQDNVVADAMSRIEAISLEEDYVALAASQETDDELASLRRSNGSSLKLEQVCIPGTDCILTCDVSTGKPRPFLTAPYRRAAFNKLHGLSHPGARATSKLVGDRYVWPGMNKDCHEWARHCVPCQRSKVTRHVSTPLGHFDTPSSRLRHVHLDIIGPLPPCNGYNYCLTAVDRSTRWPEIWPMTTMTAEAVADTFISGWISRFGVPTVVTTDQGRQFESSLFQRLMHLNATKRMRTTSYHPQANGMVERLHRQLKAALMCHGDSWVRALPLVLLGMRTALKEDIGSSAAEMLYGEPLRLPGELLVPPTSTERPTDLADYVSQLRDKMAHFRPAPASRHGRQAIFVFKDLAAATHAFLRDDAVRRPLQPPYSGPYRILRMRDKTATLDIRGREVEVSSDRIKPAHVVADEPACPARPAVSCEPPVTTPAPPSSHSSPPVTLDPPVTGTPMPVVSPPVSTAPPRAQYTTRSGRKVKFKVPHDP